MNKNQAKQINEETNDKQLFLVNAIQRKTIEVQQGNIEATHRVQDRIIGNIESMVGIMEQMRKDINRIVAVIKDIKLRIDKEAGLTSQRIVKSIAKAFCLNS